MCFLFSFVLVMTSYRSSTTTRPSPPVRCHALTVSLLSPPGLLSLPLCAAHSQAVSLRASSDASLLAPPSNGTNPQPFLAPSSAEAHEMTQAFTAMKQMYTIDDFLATPFDLAVPADADFIEKITGGINNPVFKAWRENFARNVYHMEHADYSALYSTHRDNLCGLADSLQVRYTTHGDSFDSLLRRVDAELAVRERRAPKGAAAASFVEARVAVAALHQHKHLFQGRATLHALLVQDALMFGLGDWLAEAFDWVIAKVTVYKCTWCKAVVNFLKKGACDLAGEAMCTAMVALMSGGAAVAAQRFFCRFPLYIGKIFGEWCVKGLNWILAKAGLTDDCLCGFRIPSFNVPATKFEVLGATLFSSPARSVAIGAVCPTRPGQCIGSTPEEKAAHEKLVKQEEAELAKKRELEKQIVSRMTREQKIAYHKKIIAGEIKTAMTDAMVNEFLGSVTGLGVSGAKALIAGGKKLLTGDVKGAVRETVKVAGKEIGTQVGRKIVTATTRNVVTGAVNGVINAAADQAVKVGKVGVDYAATAAGNAAGAVTTGTGRLLTDLKAGAIDLKGDKARADQVRQAGYASAQQAGAKVNSAVADKVKTVGDLAVDTAGSMAKNYGQVRRLRMGATTDDKLL